MDSLGDLLPPRINQLGLSSQLKAAYIVSQANLLAKGRFEAIHFTGGVLTVNCPSSMAAQQLRFSSQAILETINEKIKPYTIKRFSYRIKS
ncbi:MAG: DUF721 domain-containing protein [bacterium]|nr:DUF721 domain-containing protein [bacterium]